MISYDSENFTFREFMRYLENNSVSDRSIRSFAEIIL